MRSKRSETGTNLFPRLLKCDNEPQRGFKTGGGGLAHLLNTHNNRKREIHCERLLRSAMCGHGIGSLWTWTPIRFWQTGEVGGEEAKRRPKTKTARRETCENLKAAACSTELLVQRNCSYCGFRVAVVPHFFQKGEIFIRLTLFPSHFTITEC